MARIDPEEVERLAEHLVKRQYSEPRWDAKRGSVVATERVTLYGLPLVVGRRVQYGSIDPVVSRELFIRHALVRGEWTTHHRFWADNQRAIEQVAALEERARRRDIGVDDETLFELYDARIPADVVSTRHFDRWWKAARRDRPDLLTLTPEMLTNAAAAGQVRVEDYPDEVRLTQGLTLPLSYAFAPGTAEDGVTVDVPLAVLDGVAQATSGESLAFTVPGLREELVTALLRTLPKQVRRSLVPIPDRVREVLPHIDPGEPLLPALERELRRAVAVQIPPDAWQPDQVPDHLRATFRVLDDQARPLAIGKDLEALRRQVAPQSRAGLARAASTWSAPASRRGSSATLAAHRRGPARRARGHRLPGAGRRGRRPSGCASCPTQAEAGPADLGRRPPAARPRRRLAGAAGGQGPLALGAADAAVQPGRRDPRPGRRLRRRRRRRADRGGRRSAPRPGGVRGAGRDGEAAAAAAHDRYRPPGGGRADPGARGRDRDRCGAGSPGARRGRRRPPPPDGRAAAPGFRGLAGRRRLPDVVRYLRAMAHRLEKLPANAVRDELWMAAGRRGDGGVRAAAAPGAGQRAAPTTRSPASAG